MICLSVAAGTMSTFEVGGGVGGVGGWGLVIVTSDVCGATNRHRELWESVQWKHAHARQWRLYTYLLTAFLESSQSIHWKRTGEQKRGF